MSETKNYHLALTDNDQTTFRDWRNSINGSSNSNMEKIDVALENKANLSKTISTVLSASEWSSNAPYTQDIAVNGLAAEQNGIISVSQNATNEQIEAAKNAELRVKAQADNSLTIAANGDKPVYDIPVFIILLD